MSVQADKMASFALLSLAYSNIHSDLASVQPCGVRGNSSPLFLISFDHLSLALEPKQFMNSLMILFVGMLRSDILFLNALMV